MSLSFITAALGTLLTPDRSGHPKNSTETTSAWQFLTSTVISATILMFAGTDSSSYQVSQFTSQSKCSNQSKYRYVYVLSIVLLPPDAHRMPHCKDTMMLQMLATREIKLSRDSFAKVEIELLEVLRWLVHPPSPLQFVEEFLWFVRESALEKCGLTASARWLCEQHVYSGTLAKKPSAVGIAAIVCSIENSQSECKLHRVAAFVRDVQTIPGFEDLFDSDDFHRSRRYFRDLWQLYRTPHDHGVLSLSWPDTTAAVLTRSVIEEDLTRCGSSDMTPQKRTC